LKEWFEKERIIKNIKLSIEREKEKSIEWVGWKLAPLFYT